MNKRLMLKNFDLQRYCTRLSHANEKIVLAYWGNQLLMMHIYFYKLSKKNLYSEKLKNYVL